MEQPIGLKLACMGSKPTINYGAMSTIVFSNQHIKEYFDVANINYCDDHPILYKANMCHLFRRRNENMQEIPHIDTVQLLLCYMV